MPVTGPKTGFTVIDPSSGLPVDLGNRYISKDYLLTVYPNIAGQLGVRKSSGLWGAGRNFYNELSTPTNVAYSSPIQIGSLTNWKQISASGHILGIKTDGTLWAWGSNASGQLGLGDITNRSTPVQVGSLTNWKQVSCLDSHVLAIKTDGTLWTWGQNNYGQLGIGSTTYFSSPVQVGSLTTWKQVSVGVGFSSFAIKTDGTLWAWGFNNIGQLGLGDITNRLSPVQISGYPWKQIATGSGHTVGIYGAGALYAWGQNSSQQLGLGFNSTNYSLPVQVGSLTNWKSLSVGGSSSLAIKTDGTLWAWGDNTYGQLGKNDVISGNSPVQIGNLTNWKSVIMGGYYNGLAIKTDGTLWSWGDNNYGQLSLGNTTRYSSPVQIGSLTSWKSISCGYRTSIAIQDGYI
jgi:alpha-tubulin suppressor-like RCC1 family protein